MGFLAKHQAEWEPRVLSILRIVVGLLFMEHGLAKLLGFPIAAGHPAMFQLLWFAGVLEMFGGLFIALGLFTRPEKGEAHNPITCLSPRETEVFSHLVNGLRAKDIAELLDISPKTVDTYRASLMRKLNVHDLVGLVKFAIERNLTGTSGTH